MKFLKTRDVKDPNRGTPQSAGIDLFIPNDFTPQFIKPGDSILIPSGLKINVPKDHVFIMMNKSGVAVKKHLDVGACVIDEDYQGEIHIHLINAGKYFSDLCVPFANIWYVHYDYNTAFWIWFSIHMVSSTYSYAWDIYMDWGLLRSKEKGTYGLR